MKIIPFLLSIICMVMGSSQSLAINDQQDISPEHARYIVDTLTSEMKSKSVVGASLVVMNTDGRVLMSVGRGYSDAGTREPVDPGKTAFRWASMTKVVVAAAVMQSVENGKLDLDRPISDYTKILPKGAEADEITMRQLLTHTSGISDVFRGMTSFESSDAMSLHEYVSSRRATMLYPPGKYASYSNYGYALAAYVLERIEKKPIEYLIRERIARPLGLDSLSIARPFDLPPGVTLAKGHRWDGSVAPSIVATPAPAAGMTVTPLHFAKLLVALAQDGAFDDQRILSPDSIREMQRLIPVQGTGGVFGTGLGLFRDPGANVPRFSHDGELNLFKGLWAIYPTRGLVIAIVQNSEGESIAPAVLKAFEKVTGMGAARLPAKPDPARDRAVAGYYLTSRTSPGIFSPIGLMFDALHVEAVPGGIIINGQPAVLNRVSDWVYQDPADASRMYSFVPGRHSVALAQGHAGSVYLRHGTYDPLALNRNLFFATISLSILSIVGLGYLILRARRDGGQGLRALLLATNAAVLASAYVYSASLREIWNDRFINSNDIDDLIFSVLFSIAVTITLLICLAVYSARSRNIIKRMTYLEYIIYLSSVSSFMIFLYLINKWNILDYSYVF